MYKIIDSFIDTITMYRLLLYYLLGLLLAAVGLAIVGDLHYNPSYIVISSVILVAACWAINRVFAHVFEAPINSESSLITGLILALIITPDLTRFGIIFMLAASGLAIASKYLLTINKKHLFNPAALALVLTALGAKQTASWWVDTAIMLPFVILGGILIMRKLRQEPMILGFFAVSVIATVTYSFFSSGNILASLQNMMLSSPVFFLGFIMLTEPQTSPPTQTKQLWYAALVAALLPPQVHILKFYSSPELALIIGNVFAYIVSPKFKLFPAFKQRLTIASNTADFIFSPGKPVNYKPGQYLEWTLPHKHADARGSRRYLTLASSPTEPDIRIGVKFYHPSSTFKQALLNITQDTQIVASQLAGDFVMPDDQSKKLVFLAGGIGITPFRSMTKYLLDKHELRTITMLYSAQNQKDLAYQEIFEQARITLGLNITYVLSQQTDVLGLPYTISGRITPELIKQTVPDYLERTFYISGTYSMVQAMKTNLAELGVHRRNIKIDFFSGYA